MPRSNLDPVPIGSLGDQVDGNYKSVTIPMWNTVSSTAPTVAMTGIGGLISYGIQQEQSFANQATEEADSDDNQGMPIDASYLKTQKDLNDIKKGAQVTAEFYFERLKQSMTKIQQQELHDRITDLTAVLQLAPREQQVLREETQRLLAVAMLQQKAAVLGYDQVVSESDINLFRSQVEMRRPEIMELSNFPRILPAKVVRALDKVKKAELFEEFWVLTWNPAQEQVLSVKDRIIKKDPILFGKFSFDPFYLYYITSWEDETCDLTFDKMISSLKELHPDYEPAKITQLTKKDADKLIEAAQGRAAALAGTNSKRYRTDALINSLEHEDFSIGKTVSLLKALLHQLTKKAKGKSAHSS